MDTSSLKFQGIQLIKRLTYGLTFLIVILTLSTNAKAVPNQAGSTTNLSSITINGQIPSLYDGDSYNLSQLLVTGSDQNGNTYIVPTEQITWSVESGSNYGIITGSTLKIIGVGTGSIAAHFQGMKSSPVNFTSKSLPILKILQLSGAIPQMQIGGTYDLSQLTLKGIDQNNNNYPISGQSVTWAIVSQNNIANINNSILTATAVGSGSVVAMLPGVTSNSITFDIKDSIYLQSLNIEGTIPSLNVGDTFNLSQLTLKGYDQNGRSYNISGKPVTWEITSGGNSGSISGNTLTTKAQGYMTITATVLGVKSSNSAVVTVKNQPVLSSLILTGPIPAIYLGNNYNLSQLVLSGKDQYGNPYNITGMPITYTVATGSNYAYTSGNILISRAAGSGTVTATVGGITSGPIGFTILNNQGTRVLSRLVLSGSLNYMYVGNSYSLSGLSLTGYDQYDSIYSLAGQSIRWNVSSVGNYAYTSGNVLIAYAAGSGTLSATVNGINSGAIGFTILNNQGARVLSRLELSGSTPTVGVGSSYDLSRLSLTGYDQYNSVYYIGNQSISWNINYGWNYGMISGSILTGYSIGTGALTATINGVTSSPINFIVTNNPTLRSLSLSGTIPALSIGEGFDLSKLTLYGIDLNGSTYNISGLPVTYVVSSGTNFASVSGSTLRGTAIGSGTVTAYVLGVASNMVSFTIKDTPVLKALTLTDTKPILSVGKKFDLSQLTLIGTDQYGNSFNVSGQQITWSVVSTKGSVGISGNLLVPSLEDTGRITATIQNITSNPIEFRVIKDPGVLTTLTLSGEIPTISVGKTYELALLDLKAYDQYGDPYSLLNQSISFSIMSGNGFAAVSGNKLTGTAPGIGTIGVVVNGVKSNLKSFIVIKEAPKLKEISVNGSIPTLTIGTRFNLSKLTISAKDQYGEPFDISGKQVFWKVQGDKVLLFVTGSILSPIAAGTQAITATVAGVASKPINVVIKAVPVLKTVTLSSSIKELIYGKTYDLSKIITLKGKDQYGNAYNISGKPVVWRVTIAGKNVSVSGRTLRITAKGIVKITTTVGGVTSSTITTIARSK